MPESDDTGDFFAVRSASFPIAVAIMAGTLVSFDGGGLLILDFFLISLPCLGAWVGYMLVRVFRADPHKRWRELVSRLVILVCIWPCFVCLGLYSGDYVHLAIMYPSYLFKIGIDQQIETRFDWDDARFVGTGYQRVLVFDPSDRIIQNDTARSSDSTAPALIRHLLGHFYLGLEVPAH